MPLGFDFFAEDFESLLTLASPLIFAPELAPSLLRGGSITTTLTQRQAFLPALTGLWVRAQVQVPFLDRAARATDLGLGDGGFSGFGSGWARIHHAAPGILAALTLQRRSLSHARLTRPFVQLIVAADLTSAVS